MHAQYETMKRGNLTIGTYFPTELQLKYEMTPIVHTVSSYLPIHSRLKTKVCYKVTIKE